VASAQLIDRVALGFVACGALIALASPHGFAQSEQDRAQKLRQRTFDVVWKTVNDKYFDPQFGGVDWAGVRLKYAPQVASSNTDAELVGLLSRMLSEIKISHLQILDLTTLAKQLARAEVTRGVTHRLAVLDEADIDVSLTRQELLKNRDAQLEAAIAHLQKSGPRAGR
jgi:hypothetical protein